MKIDVSEMKGPLGELMDQLSGPNGTERLHQLNLWLKGVAVRLLNFLGAFTTPAISRFEAAIAFGPNNPDGIRFWMGENFKKVMLSKVEEGVPAGELAIHQLEQTAHDPEIMVELGVGKRIVKLAQFHWAIKSGAIPKDGSVTVAYILGNDGNVWAVHAHWYSSYHGWSVDADSVGSPIPWYAGDQVMSQV